MQAVLDDWRTAPVNERTKAMLGFLETLSMTPDAVTAKDMAPLRAAGLNDAAIEEAIHVSTLFNVYVRLADAFEFHIPDEIGFEKSATSLLKRGYL